jgi:hypothetical protein
VDDTKGPIAREEVPQQAVIMQIMTISFFLIIPTRSHYCDSSFIPDTAKPRSRQALSLQHNGNICENKALRHYHRYSFPFTMMVLLLRHDAVVMGAARLPLLLIATCGSRRAAALIGYTMVGRCRLCEKKKGVSASASLHADQKS